MPLQRQSKQSYSSMTTIQGQRKYSKQSHQSSNVNYFVRNKGVYRCEDVPEAKMVEIGRTFICPGDDQPEQVQVCPRCQEEVLVMLMPLHQDLHEEADKLSPDIQNITSETTHESQLAQLEKHLEASSINIETATFEDEQYALYANLNHADNQSVMKCVNKALAILATTLARSAKYVTGNKPVYRFIPAMKIQHKSQIQLNT